jgi:N-acetylglutamate synthase-like GNAT family acetyltransferase
MTAASDGRCAPREPGTVVSSSTRAAHPDIQARGLGEKILETLKHKVRHHRRIILHAKPGKEDFYPKRGFSRMKTSILSPYIVPVERNREAGIIEQRRAREAHPSARHNG